MSINRTKILNAAQKYYQKRNWEKAAREYSKLVEDDPSDARNQLKLADCLVKDGDHSGALAAYKSVAYYYLEDDIYDKAVAIFKQALRLAPKDAELHSALGDAYHHLGRLKEANRAYSQGYKIYKSKQDAPSQRRTLEKMTQIDPEDYALRIQLAERYAKDQMKDKAIAIFESAASLLQDEGRTEEYLQVAERILYLDKSKMDVRKKVIRLNMDARNYERALKHLQVAFKHDQSNTEVLRMLGIAFEQLGKPEKAAIVFMDLARMHFKSDEAKRVVEALHNVLRLNPNHAEARRMMARFEQRRKQARDSGVQPLPERARPQERARLQPPARPAPAPTALPEIELLDDDLDLGGAFSVTSPSSPRVPAVIAQAQPRELSLDQQWGDGTFEGIDLDLGQIKSYHNEPPKPDLPEIQDIHELQELNDVLDIEFVPEVSDPEEFKIVEQHISETKVFLKYGLYDKAIQSLMDVSTRFPTNVEVREELASVYILRKQGMLAANQFFELAKIVQHQPALARDYLERAKPHLDSHDVIWAVANQIGLNLELDEPRTNDLSVAEATLDEFSDGQNVDDFLDGMFGSPPVSEAPAVAPGFGLNFDDLMEPSEVLELDDADLILEDDSFAEETTSPDAVWADGAVDDMFNDLFKEVDTSGLRASAMGRSSISGIGGLDELDGVIEQGLLKEQRRLDLGNMQAGPSSSHSMSDDHFGLNSLSGAFGGLDEASMPNQPAVGGQVFDLSASMPGLANVGGGVMNTNYELGAAYMDMGLVEEALDEFKQATTDPQIRDLAIYSIALCETRLGRNDQARGRVDQLLRQPSLDARVAQSARALLNRLAST